MLLLFLALLGYIFFSAVSDWAQIELRDCLPEERAKLQQVWHSADAANRVLVFSVVSWLLTYNEIKTVLYTLFGLAVYWLVFDVVLNTFRNKPTLYVGYTAAMDRGLRQMAESINVAPEVLAVLLKTALIGIIFLLLRI